MIGGGRRIYISNKNITQKIYYRIECLCGQMNSLQLEIIDIIAMKCIDNTQTHSKKTPFSLPLRLSLNTMNDEQLQLNSILDESADADWMG